MVGIGATPHFVARDATGAKLTERRWPQAAAADHGMLDESLDWVEGNSTRTPWSRSVTG